LVEHFGERVADLAEAFVRGTHESDATVEAQAAFGNYLRTRMASRDRAKCLQRWWAVKDSNLRPWD